MSEIRASEEAEMENSNFHETQEVPVITRRSGKLLALSWGYLAPHMAAKDIRILGIWLA